MNSERRPVIGVFDSGFGGLTVLKELATQYPDANYLYFGDTARLPYGSKSVETVAKYAVEAAHFLESQKADLLVIGLHQHDFYVSRLWSSVYDIAQDAPCSVLGVH